jgi:SAM-dependent methyltransferase
MLLYFRKRRMKQFQDEFNIQSDTRILDIGGTSFNWNLVDRHCRLTILNLTRPKMIDPRYDWLIADGRYLPFKDDAFDIVYSNSVIEHLSNKANQASFAEECMRVGRKYYIQTPNKWFPVEPHLITPVIHWLPKQLQKRLLRNFTLWGLITRPTQQYCDSFVQEVELLDQKRLKALFPGAKIWKERVLGLTKSLVAVKDELKPS